MMMLVIFLSEPECCGGGPVALILPDGTLERERRLLRGAGRAGEMRR